ncbi:hypothetical protein BDK51DRAFT_33051 [Blyttiomyces helicus]|uniref:SGNH hydrolase-type esterase domain-containing protein n=1 Tax=Blyttiomyces helicus TaxID=388810 RepID=A0A4P9WB40_9FUNG|nr:hypothetical protein BDK51DRAFT_33051 [Blyttiomyces helicus]|eukprot:RKO88120.1 hypothetical protein BDK51DRAFT_33051 [Blyttiomyces helicus]
MLVGANDACLSCLSVGSLTHLSNSAFEAHIRQVIESLRTQIPRLVVHIGTLFHVSGVYTLTADEPECKAIRDLGITRVECTCALAGGNTFIGGANRNSMDAATDGWNGVLNNIAADYAVGMHDDFAVLVDQGTGGIDISTFPRDFISTVDCFHPSVKAHAVLAKNIWNNLFVPAEEKSDAYSPATTFGIYCPTESDRIRF